MGSGKNSLEKKKKQPIIKISEKLNKLEGIEKNGKLSNNEIKLNEEVVTEKVKN